MTSGGRAIRARAVVREILSRLPPDLRERAALVPVAFETRPSRPDIEAGAAPDDLGVFCGPSLRDADASEIDDVPEITLFLDNIWSYSGRDLATFEEEVERTYLHELGHYFGFEERDMASRDLD